MAGDRMNRDIEMQLDKAQLDNSKYGFLKFLNMDDVVHVEASIKSVTANQITLTDVAGLWPVDKK
jgi:hypothetical protein